MTAASAHFAGKWLSKRESESKRPTLSLTAGGSVEGVIGSVSLLTLTVPAMNQPCGRVLEFDNRTSCLLRLSSVFRIVDSALWLGLVVVDAAANLLLTGSVNAQ